MSEIDFYTRYYAAVGNSHANTAYCQRLFGENLAQHGFAEMGHLDHLIAVTGIRAHSRVLDLGCGNGGIAETISDQTGAHVTGIDFVPEAIRQAQERTKARRERLDFQVMEMERLDFPPASFDIITTVDTLYFIKLDEVLPVIVHLLKPGGRIGAFWSQSLAWEEPEKFDRSTLPPDHTELAVALHKLDLSYQTWDYSQTDYEHAQRKQQITEDLRTEFEAEGNLFLYENHRDEAAGVMRAFEAGMHARYLYRIDLSKGKLE
jgi:SAM-dependent methyltransferase